MMRGGHGPIRQLQDLNWGAFNQASHAPQCIMQVDVVHIVKCVHVHIVILDIIMLSSVLLPSFSIMV